MQVEKSQAEWAMELNDVRLALARSEERAAKLEYENGWLLKGMASLTRARSMEALFDVLFSILRPLIGFEQAAVLVRDEPDGLLHARIASHPLLQGSRWPVADLFGRVLGGETVALFEPASVSEFSGLTSQLQDLLGSALLTALDSSQGPMILLLTHSDCHHLDLDARNRLERYRPLLDQALLNVAYRARLERKVAERTRALARSQQLFRQFAEMSSDWFWLTDREHRFVQFPGDLAGASFHSELMAMAAGRSFIDYLTDEERKDTHKWAHYLAELEAHKPIRNFRFATYFDNKEHWVAISADPHFDEQGVFQGYRGTLNDITHMVARNLELKRAKEQADAANRAKSEFLAVMSHEIRTPMQAILGMLDLLGQSALNVEQRSLIKHVSHSAALLQTLLHDLLDISRIDSGEMALESISFEFLFVINSVITQLEERAHSKQITLLAQLASDLPVQLQGDPLRLTQILFNLLGNAIKFTDEGSVRLKISRQGADLLFEVFDTGIGIPAGQRGLLFTPFQQLDPSMTRRFGGTGLGLAISRRLVELMGGEIGVESEQGKGSRFWFSIPCRVGVTAPGSAHREPELASLPALTVLLVEDSPVNQQVIKAMLERLGLTVLLANDGAMALEILNCCAPDVVLMDLRMPVMDGLEATRRIRQSKSTVPVLAFTANASGEDIDACMAAGMDGVVSKPVTLDRLHKELLAIFGKKNGQH